MWAKGNGKQERETLWWDETVESLVTHKRKTKEGSGRNEAAKKDIWRQKGKAKSGVYVAKGKAQKEKFSQQESSTNKNFIFKPAKRTKHENQDTVGEKCMKNDEGCLTYDDSAKLKSWENHYERLLNV